MRAASADAGASERAILVVHIGAGPLVPSIVDRMAGHVDGIVFVDATLPHPGQAGFDRASPEMAEQLNRLAQADGILPSLPEWFPAEAVSEMVPDAATRAETIAEMPRVPLAYFAEIAPSLDKWATLPCSYLQLSTAYDGAAAQARAQGWAVATHNGHHLSAVCEPVAVANAILGLAAR